MFANLGLFKRLFKRMCTCFVVLAAFVAGPLQAAPLAYQLKPVAVAEGVYVLEGKTQDFSRANGGNVVNTAFIIGEEGVLVFDTGPSLKYGKALRQAIASITPLPITQVLISHHHPDHIFGNQAFADLPILGFKQTAQGIDDFGADYSDNMYRMVGDWMRGTHLQGISQTINEGPLAFAGRQLEVLRFSGHTGADLAVFDHTSGVLLAGDMVFVQRMLTTPHTPGLAVWRAELDQLMNLPVTAIVPGHGPVQKDTQGLKDMQAYLTWLDDTLSQAAQRGASMNELMQTPMPPAFADIPLARSEFLRSVVHLYPKYEEAAF